jgi:predicted transcriptional regulator
MLKWLTSGSAIFFSHYIASYSRLGYDLLLTEVPMRTAKVVSISLPPDMEKEVQKVAKEEHRTISELLREAFRQYLTNRDLASVRLEGRRVAKRLKLKPDDVAKIVRSGRK